MSFKLIPFLLLFVPILEIAVFILIGGKIGIAWTLAMILVTAILGSILLRVQGISIIAKIQQETQAGRIPGKALGNGAMIMVAGVLLLTPGFVTDGIGFLLFFPPFRSVIWNAIASRVKVTTQEFGSGFDPRSGDPFGDPYRRQHPDEDDVVDLEPDEFSEKDPDAKRIEDPTDKPSFSKDRPGWAKLDD